MWILFLHRNATVKAHQKISATEGGFTGGRDDHDTFGSSLAALGDLNGGGVTDLAVGATNDGGSGRGAVWVLFLHSNGTVKAHQKITDGYGGFTGSLTDFDKFGSSLAALGDVDGDTVGDLPAGANRAGGRGPGSGVLARPDTHGQGRAQERETRAEGDRREGAHNRRQE